MNDPGMQRDTYRVLVMCDDEFTALEIRQAIGGEMLSIPAFGSATERHLRFDYQDIVLGGRWEIHIDTGKYDIAIIATDDAANMHLFSDHPLLQNAIGCILYLPGPGEIGTWRMRPGVDAILRRPCSQLALRERIERMLRQYRLRRSDETFDVIGMKVLTSLLGQDLRQVAPVLDPRSAGGISYAAAQAAVGDGVDVPVVLEDLVDRGLFQKKVALRLRRCPACESALLSYGECCGRCGSLDFSTEPIIHHFHCSHVDIAKNFRRDDELVCPKCHESLLQIGRDYEQPNGCVYCRSCTHLAPNAHVHATCMECGVRSTPEQTTEAVAYQYEATAAADAAMVRGSLHIAAADSTGVDVLSRGHHGLYSASYVRHALNRECDRFRRHAHPATLLLIDIPGLSALHARDADGHRRLISACSEASVVGLRALDAACQWSENAFAVLLPDTPLAGATVVAGRIGKRMDAVLAGLGLTHRIAAATVSTTDDHVDAVVRRAEEAMRPGEESAAEMVVIDDDLMGAGPR